MSAFPGFFVASLAHAAGSAPGASVALIGSDLAAGGWLLVGLTVAAAVGLFFCRDHKSPSVRPRSLASRPWTVNGWFPSRPHRSLAHR